MLYGLLFCLLVFWCCPVDLFFQLRSLLTINGTILIFFSNFFLDSVRSSIRRLLPYLVNIIMEAFHGDILCVHNLSCYYNCRNRLSYTICASHLSIYRHGVICIPVYFFLNELSLAVKLSVLVLCKLDISIITSKGCLFLLLHWRQVTHLLNNYY